MITLKQLNPYNYPLSKEIEDNLLELQARINKLEEAYGKRFRITSGLRSDAQQAALIKAGKSTATKSNHLIGKAADIADADGKLKDWAVKNEALLAEIELWCEAPTATPQWLHVQICPPKSGRRFFNP